MAGTSKKDAHVPAAGSYAKANLNGQSLERFHGYKDRLIADGHTWKGDAELILTGFIWDESEGREE